MESLNKSSAYANWKTCRTTPTCRRNCDSYTRNQMKHEIRNAAVFKNNDSSQYLKHCPLYSASCTASWYVWCTVGNAATKLKLWFGIATHRTALVVQWLGARSQCWRPGPEPLWGHYFCIHVRGCGVTYRPDFTRILMLCLWLVYLSVVHLFWSLSL